MKRSIFFVLLLLISIRALSQNLVANAGFETWNEINNPDGWSRAQNCLQESSIIYSGIYSCRQATTSDSKDLEQLIPVIAGKHYRFSCWYKNDPAGTGNGCRIWSGWTDINENSISDDLTKPLLHSGYLKSDVWSEYSVDVTAPPSASYFNLIIRTLPNSVTYWDEVGFEENFPTTKNELNANNVRIYPNPASGYLIISDAGNVQHINIYSLSGVSFWSENYQGENRVSINTSNFPDGMYLIKISSANRTIFRKFIKGAY